MAKQAGTLRKIAALKRQSAEQYLRTVQNDAEQIEAALTGLSDNLGALDEVRAGFDAHRLSEENGYARKLLADIRSAEESLALKRAELLAAREALKRVFHSEERLSQAGP